MNNRFLSVVYKVVGIVYAVLVGGMALLLLISSFGSPYESGIGIFMFLIYASVAFVVLTMFWGFSNALSDLDDMRENNRMLLEQNRKILRALKTLGAPDCEDNPSGYSLSDIPSPEYSGSKTWICPKCGQENPSSQRMCKDCGYQK